MKILGFFVVSLFLVGCGMSKVVSSDQNDDKDAIWQYGVVSKFVLNPNVNSDSTTVNIHYTLAKSDAVVKKITDSLISTYLDLTCCLQPNELIGSSTLEKYSESFLQDYLNVVNNESPSAFPWNLSLDLDFCYINKNYIKAEFSTETYMGGAHGNVNFTSYMIDSRTNKIVRLEDICSNVSELEKRAEQIFRSNYGISKNADLDLEGFWFQDNKFKLNQNFFFNEKSITFIFNQYEIAPYVMGIFEIEIPFSNNKDIIHIER